MEVVLEIGIKAPGLAITKLLRREADPDGGLVLWLGVLSWALVAGLGYWLYRTLV